MEENTEANVKFSLKKIVTQQFAMVEDAYNTEKEVVFNVALKFGVDQAKKRIVVVSGFRFEQEKAPFLMIEGSCHFEINETAWQSFIKPEKNVIVIPEGFLGHLTMITIGTIRGSLHAKTENTDFNKFIIPPINVLKLIRKDLEITLEDRTEPKA